MITADILTVAGEDKTPQKELEDLERQYHLKTLNFSSETCRSAIHKYHLSEDTKVRSICIKHRHATELGYSSVSCL